MIVMIIIIIMMMIIIIIIIIANERRIETGIQQKSKNGTEILTER
jgi:uncharacterized membrane protein